MLAEHSTNTSEGVEKYGRLTVLKRFRRADYDGSWCLCLCDCGKQKEARERDLKLGKTQSCGCLFKERITTHGRSRSKCYEAWRGMRERCQNQKNKRYPDYGGRGITVCNRWSGSDGFAAFLADLGEPSPGFSLDRIDNDGNYEPDNCRWVSREVQQRNRRNNRLLTYQGRTQSLAAWVEELNVHRVTVDRRLARGWSVEQALTIPVGEKRCLA